MAQPVKPPTKTAPTAPLPSSRFAQREALGYRLGFEATAGLEPLELLQRQLHEALG